MEKLFVIKIGGTAIDDEVQLDSFLRDFANLKEKKILVHGGGKLATDLATKLGIQQQMIDGRRITDAATLDVCTMVYAGLVNKKIVAKLQALGINALGISGADGNCIPAKRRTHGEIDYGFVGDPDDEKINTDLIISVLTQQMLPVFCAITHDGKGNLLNTNADTIAAVLSSALSSYFQVQLVYSFEKDGVLKNINDHQTIISQINREEYLKLKTDKIISNGMIPKMDNAFGAIYKGVRNVFIMNTKDISSLNNITNVKGTKLSLA